VEEQHPADAGRAAEADRVVDDGVSEIGFGRLRRQQLRIVDQDVGALGERYRVRMQRTEPVVAGSERGRAVIGKECE
jgi:hypothetical protein